MAGYVETEQDAEGGGLSFLSAIPAMLWQRRWVVIVPAVLATIAAVVAAFLMRPVYSSNATVLIESPQITDDVLNGLAGSGPNSGDAIGQRVARARERVLSRMDMIRMIRSYGLYPREQRSMPLSKIVDKMRGDTTIQAQDTAVMGGTKANLGLANTIAITVGFNYEDPVKAQIVAQQFVERFLSSDAGTQEGQANDTVNFLTEQANQVQAQLAQIEDRIARFQSSNGQLLSLGTSGASSGPADVASIDGRIAALQAENAKLGSGGGAPSPQDAVLAEALAKLHADQARFSDSHPDVQADKALVESARREAASHPGSNPNTAAIAANRAELQSLLAARGMIASHSSSVIAAQSRAPLVSGQLDQLEKAADVAREQYRAIAGKLQAAQIQARMESEQKGERLVLSDPPVVPDHPIKPNRPLIIAGGIIAGLGIGVALAFMLELVFRPIRGSAAVKEVLGAPPLSIVPDFDVRQGWLVRMLERRTRKKVMARA